MSWDDTARASEVITTRKSTHIGLTIARYGIIGFLLLSELSPRPGAAGWRVGAVVAALLALAAIGYLITRRGSSARVAQTLVGLEIGLALAAGLLHSQGNFWLIYFIVLADVFFAFPLPAATAMGALTYGTLALNFYLLGIRGAELVESMISLLFGFIFFGAATRLAVEHGIARQRAERLLAELEDAHTQLQAYAAEVETLSVARERQRLAQEVHDSVAHVLTGLLVQLQASRRLLQTNPAAARDRLAGLEEVVRRGLDEVRRAVRAMRPEHLEAVGGIEAMRRLCDQFAERSGMRVSFATEGTLSLTPAQEVLVFRALQECLTNAARHGRASNVWAVLRTSDGRTELRVRDDGAGAQQVQPGMGLGGMRERAQSAGGRFLYHTATGQGFEAVMELPLTAAPAARA